MHNNANPRRRRTVVGGLVALLAAASLGMSASSQATSDSGKPAFNGTETAASSAWRTN